MAHNLKFIRRTAAAAISIGRSNSVSVTGSGSSFTIGWSSGGAAANGTWLVAVIGETTSATHPLISGGSTWTRLGSTNCYYKQCGVSEPTTYTVQYVGSTKGDGTNVSILEIIGSSAVDVSGSATSTATSPTVTTTATDCIVLAMRDSAANAATPPSGYTRQTYSSVNAASSLATKLLVASGSVAPGSWSASCSALHTLAFKV